MNYCNSKRCKACGSPLAAGRSKKAHHDEHYNVGRSPGRPQGTIASRGYAVSEGRPSGTTASEGYGVSSGRPSGTTASEGYGVSSGRPSGTTASEGYGVSSGRPSGTTASEGYGVSSGRPAGTTRDKGYKVGLGQSSNHVTVDCSSSQTWDSTFPNVDSDLTNICKQRIQQQQKFDRKSLGIGVCYGCGHVLWSSVDGSHTFLVNKPAHMTAADAPASAYLRAVPNCTLSFEYLERGSSTKERWYACSSCKTAMVPTEMHVGNIFIGNLSNVKPVSEWDMCLPKPVQDLCNNYETGQVALCGLFSNTVKKASMSQYHHLQGEINAIQKLDRHYYGLFGFLAVKDSDIFTKSPDPHSSLRIKRALRCFRDNNHLYSDFFAQYETLFRFVKPGFINPDLLEQQNIPLERLLEDEAAGMAFPLDAKYFDDFPLVHDEPKLGPSDKAGRQYPKHRSRDKLQDLCHTTYGEKYLDAKAFPHLHPYGHGGWYHKCPMAFQSHIKMRLFDIRGIYAADPSSSMTTWSRSGCACTMPVRW